MHCFGNVLATLPKKITVWFSPAIMFDSIYISGAKKGILYLLR